MMIRTAGGPAVSPLDFNERKQRLPKSAWVAIGVVAAAHVAVGVALYYQRFELAHAPLVDETPPTVITMIPRPKEPDPIPKVLPQKPVAPNTVVHETVSPQTPTDTITAVHGEALTDSTTLTLSEPVTDAVPDARPAVEPQPPRPAVITNPSWIRQPNAEQMGRAYPERAIANGIAGSATLNCSVHANGSVGECSVTRETPGGYGFGRAAVSLSRYFRINPRTVDGDAVDATVSINLRFNPPQD